jgi:hypothetical protein
MLEATRTAKRRKLSDRIVGQAQQSSTSAAEWLCCSLFSAAPLQSRVDVDPSNLLTGAYRGPGT